MDWRDYPAFETRGVYEERLRLQVIGKDTLELLADDHTDELPLEDHVSVDLDHGRALRLRDWLSAWLAWRDEQ